MALIRHHHFKSMYRAAEKRLCYVDAPDLKLLTDELKALGQLKARYAAAAQQRDTSEEVDAAAAPSPKVGLTPSRPDETSRVSSELGGVFNPLPLAEISQQETTVRAVGNTAVPLVIDATSKAGIIVQNRRIIFRSESPAKEVQLSMTGRRAADWKISAKAFRAGRGTIIQLIPSDSMEPEVTLFMEGGELRSVISKNPLPGCPNAQPFKAGPLKVFPFQNAILVEKPGSKPTVIALLEPVQVSSFISDSLSPRAIIVKLQPAAAQHSTVLVFGEDGALVRSPLQGDVTWTQDGRLIESRGTKRRIYPPLAGAASIEGAAFFGTPTVATTIDTFAQAVRNALSGLDAAAEADARTKIAALQEAARRARAELPRDVQTDPLMGRIFGVLKIEIDNIETTLRGSAEAGAAAAAQVEGVKTAATGLNTRVRELVSRPAAGDPVEDLLSKIHEVDESFAAFERQFQRLSAADQRRVEGEINITNARSDRGQLYQRLETHAAELAASILRTGNPEQETIEALSEKANNLNDREGNLMNPILRTDVNALRSLLTAVEGLLQKVSQWRTLLETAHTERKYEPNAESSPKIVDASSIENTTKVTRARRIFDRLDRMIPDNENIERLTINGGRVVAGLHASLSRLAENAPVSDFQELGDQGADALESIVTGLPGDILQQRGVAQTIDRLRARVKQEVDSFLVRRQERLQEMITRLTKTAKPNYAVVLGKIRSAKTLAALDSVITIRDYDLRTGRIMGAYNAGSPLHRAVRAAEALRDLGTTKEHEDMISGIRAAYQRQDVFISEARSYKRAVTDEHGHTRMETVRKREQGQFGFECPSWSPTERVEVQRSSGSAFREMHFHEEWDPEGHGLRVDISSISSIRKEDNGEHSFLIDDSEQDHGRFEHLNFCSPAISTEEVIAYRMVQVYLRDVSKEAADTFRKNFRMTLQRSAPQREAMVEDGVSYLQKDLENRYGKKLMAKDRIENIARIFIALFQHWDEKNTSGYENFNEIFQDDILLNIPEPLFDRDGAVVRIASAQDLRQRFEAYSTEVNGIEHLEAVQARIIAYEKFLLETTGLSHFQISESSGSAFLVGPLQVNRAKKIMASREMARIGRDVGGYTMSGPPGEGKTVMQQFIEQKEGGLSIQVDGTRLAGLKNWDPWSPENVKDKAVQTELIKVWVGLVSGWNVTIDEAHNLSPELEAQLKRIIQTNGTLTTGGSPAADVNGYHFSPAFPAGTYRRHPGSVLVLIKNLKRDIDKDGRFKRSETAEQMSTKEALARRLIEIDLDGIDLAPENRDYLRMDYLIRASMNNGIHRDYLIVFSQLIAEAIPLDINATGLARIPAAGTILTNAQEKIQALNAEFNPTADGHGIPLYSDAELRVFEQKLINRMLAINAIVQIREAVYQNGNMTQEAMDDLYRRVSSGDVALAAGVHPPCYLTSVGGGDIESFITTLNETSGIPARVLQLTKEYLLEKKVAHSMNKSIDEAWVYHVLGLDADKVRADGMREWDYQCQEARRRILMMGSQNPVVGSLETLREGVAGELGQVRTSLVNLSRLVDPIMAILTRFADLFGRGHAAGGRRPGGREIPPS